MLDWVAHLEHLQSILFKYDPVGATTKPTMLRYFCKDLKPSILAELKHQDLELKSFNQMLKKTVNVKAKVALQPRFNTKKIDQNCPIGSHSANSTIAKSQSNIMKDHRTKKPKVRGTESLSGLQRSESSEKTRKEKKKK